MSGNIADQNEPDIKVKADIANAYDLERQREQQELIDKILEGLGWGKNDDPQNDARNSYKIPKESELYGPANELAKSLKCKKCLIIVKINEDGKLAVVGVKADGEPANISDKQLSDLNKILGKLTSKKQKDIQKDPSLKPIETPIKMTSPDNNKLQPSVVNKVKSGVGTNKVKSQRQ